MATIGLSKPYVAKYAAEGTKVTYTDPQTMGKAVEVNIEIETAESNDLYADNSIAETDRSFANGTLTIGTDDLSQDASKLILGLQERDLSSLNLELGDGDAEAKELVYDDDQVVPYLGFGGIIKKKVGGVYKWRAVVLCKVMFSVPADAATTQGESIEWQTPSLTATIMRGDDEKHMWKREATFSTEANAEKYIKAVLGQASEAV